jgi:hypothetical protein
VGEVARREKSRRVFYFQRNMPLLVIPAKAGIQRLSVSSAISSSKSLDSRFRGNDDAFFDSRHAAEFDSGFHQRG